MQYLSSYNWLISLSLIASWSMHVATNDRISFSYKVEQQSIVCVCMYVYTCRLEVSERLYPLKPIHLPTIAGVAEYVSLALLHLAKLM